MLEQHSYTDINAATWDQWARDGIAWSIPVSHEVFQRAQAGQWDVILTASRPVPHSWFGELAGKRVLGLASGGGQQIPHFVRSGRGVHRAGLLPGAAGPGAPCGPAGGLRRGDCPGRHDTATALCG